MISKEALEALDVIRRDLKIVVSVDQRTYAPFTPPRVVLKVALKLADDVLSESQCSLSTTIM